MGKQSSHELGESTTVTNKEWTRWFRLDNLKRQLMAAKWDTLALTKLEPLRAEVDTELAKLDKKRTVGSV